eukprot:3937821-Rhodomonas_salina.4
MAAACDAPRAGELSDVGDEDRTHHPHRDRLLLSALAAFCVCRAQVFLLLTRGACHQILSFPQRSFQLHLSAQAATWALACPLIRFQVLQTLNVHDVEMEVLPIVPTAKTRVSAR